MKKKKMKIFSTWLKYFNLLSFQRGITFGDIFFPLRAINQNVETANFFETKFSQYQTLLR